MALRFHRGIEYITRRENKKKAGKKTEYETRVHGKRFRDDHEIRSMRNEITNWCEI